MAVPSRRHVKRLAQSARGPLIAASSALAAFELARRIFRSARLFCPSREPVQTWLPEDYGLPADQVDEHWMETPDGALLHAWYCRAESPIASALYCHGNTGNLTNTAYVLPYLVRSGVSVLLFDYRGFGRSSGRPSLNGVIADGVTAARYHDRLRPRERPAILYGYSLGGAIAAQVATQHLFDGLILQSTFTNLPDLTRSIFPRLPLYLLSGRCFDTLAVIRRLLIPMLVIHGTDDETIPLWMGQRIYDTCPTEKRIHIISDGRHKDLYLRDPDTIVSAIDSFVASLPSSARAVTNAAVPKRKAIDDWLDAALRVIRREIRRRFVPQSL